VAFRCAHRGTQLSTGWVEGDDLRCFYHGWEYNADGQCIEQPAEPEPFCGRIKIRSYPIQEYLGLIFAYLGESEPPPFPRYPWFEEDDGLSTFEVYGDQAAPFNWWNKIDNDAPHLPFVHRVPGQPFGDMISIHSEETEYGTCDYTVQGGQRNMTHHIMPNARLFVSFRPPGGWQERLNFDAVPVDDTHTVAYGIGKNHFYTREALEAYLARPLPPPPSPDEPTPVDVAARILRGELTIAEVQHRQLVYIQDVTSQWGQGTTLDRSREHLGRSDSGVIAWRTIWEREMRALAEGRPLKAWRIPDRLELNHAFMADYPTLVT
jgi:5,5'-dehydrodivanillate O-demethylase